MTMKTTPLLITSAINVSAPFVSITQANDRLKLTLDALAHWAQVAPGWPIVICDGSGFDLNALQTARPEIDFSNVELLSFVNDQTRVKALGKGFGEGEIVNHAVRHSSLIRQAGCFSKCTSKLWVDNFLACVQQFDGGIRLLKMYDRRKLTYEKVDTRFYMVDVDFYQTHFSRCHETVSDGTGYYLEHAFADVVKTQGLRRVDFSTKPLLFGYSGSTGVFQETLPESLGGRWQRTVRRWMT